MTTVVSPSSSPVVIFNRSGTAIVSIAAALVTTPTANDAPDMPYVCGHMIALVSTNFRVGFNDSYVVRLPADSEVGDMVEVYCQPVSASPASWPVTVLVPVGETLYDPNGVAAAGKNNDPGYYVPHTSSGIGPGALFRKIATATWQVVGAI